MSRKAREVETLLLTMFAALPLYVTGAVGKVPLLLFHGVMAVIVVRVLRGHGPEVVPARVMRIVALFYIPFYLLDAAVLSRSAIAASTHLVLFIAVYQPTESLRVNNQAQRMLTIALIFIASLATSTHIAIVPFVIAFAFVMFRQLMYVSHLETVRSIGREYSLAPASSAAVFYLGGATLIGLLLFPLLPRTRNPLVQGQLGGIPNQATGLSETIDFSAERVQPNDSTVVARVWIRPEAIPLFTPLRLRGNVYDRYRNNEWRQSHAGIRGVPQRGGEYQLARPAGFTGSATVQQRTDRGRLYLPVGTFALRGVSNVAEGPARETFSTFQARGGTAAYDVTMAQHVEPLTLRRVPLLDYPLTPPVIALAQQIARGAATPADKAKRVEAHLFSKYKYVARGEQVGAPITTDEFLLRDRRGHCEYFAAGMVALLTALDVPARVVGGFYGGQLNPLGGYLIIRREDAHAWVEVWDGEKWMTYDPTPPSLRPGAMNAGAVGAYIAALADAVNYFWDRYVLTFGLADQIALMGDVFTRIREISQQLQSGAAGGMRGLLSRNVLPVLAVLLGVVALAAVIRRGRRPMFELLADHLRARGVEMDASTTMEEALTQLRASNPDAARELEPLVALYEQERFSPKADPARRRQLRQRLAELKV